MKESYRDIRELIDQEPQWYDEHGVPRYCEFHPSRCSNIYAAQAALVLLKCQDCGNEMKCAVSCDRWICAGTKAINTKNSLAEAINEGYCGYGDPPCWNDCAGASMTPYEIRVIEFWQTNEIFEWERVPKLEGFLHDGLEHGKEATK